MNQFWIGFLGGTFAILFWNVARAWVLRLEGAWVQRSNGRGTSSGDRDVAAHAPSLPYPWNPGEFPPGIYGHTDQELANEEQPEVRDEKRFRGPGY